MAGKGGGAWKVAYADFVTAMMAFFLVMWITAQDQSIKQAVSYYFTEPMAVGKKPTRSGAVHPDPVSGVIPKDESVALGKGRQSNTGGPPSPGTKAVSDFVFTDPAAKAHWRKQAGAAREAAAASAEVKAGKPVEEVATKKLARQMKDEFIRTAPQASGVHQDLLFLGLNDVNWDEIAEDFLRQ